MYNSMIMMTRTNQKMMNNSMKMNKFSSELTLRPPPRSYQINAWHQKKDGEENPTAGRLSIQLIKQIQAFGKTPHSEPTLILFTM